MIRAVLFDLYDTLIYLDGPAIVETRRQLAIRARVDPDAWAALWHDNILDRMLGKLGGLEDEIRTMLRQLGADPAPALITELAEIEMDGWARAVTVYPETLPALTALRERGLLLGLVSNCSVQAGAVLERIGLAERFDAVTLSFDVGIAKPDPGIFEAACRRLGVSTTECLFVADGAFAELDAARALGMIAVKIEQPHQSGDYATNDSYDYRVTRLTDVLALLPAGAADPAAPSGPLTHPGEGAGSQTADLPPIFDPAGLLGTDIASSAEYREIVELFLDEAPRRLREIAAAAQAGDRPRIARLAHTLAGSALSLGAMRFAAGCTRLEVLTRDQPPMPSGAADADAPVLFEAVAGAQQAFEELQAALSDGAAER